MTNPPPDRADAIRAPGALAPPRPDLDWSDPRSLKARGVGDVYYSAADGLAETRAVFLGGCDLPQRWAETWRFVVAELGFGSGLNLLALWDLWRRTRPAGASLHFVSIEGLPLTAGEAARAHARWPELAPLAARLAPLWPPRVKGVHRRRIDEDGLVLTIAHLEAGEALDALEFTADAWFLDGFAPARNPEMWRAEVLAAVAARSAPGARAASFTVAGAVRRGLEEVGFAVAKKPGFAAKRERLEAVYRGGGDGCARPPHLARTHTRDGPVLVIGAGLAGAAAARAFTRRGLDVTVLEAGPAPAGGASGNPAGLVMPRLDLDDRPPARFLRAAYAHALTELPPSAFDPIGAVALALDGAEAARQARLLDAEALPGDMAAAVAGEALIARGAKAVSGVGFPQAGVARPGDVVAAWLGGAQLRCGAAVGALAREGDRWIARDAADAVLGEGAICVLAAGPGLARFAQTAFLEIRPSRGQITFAAVPGPDLAYAFGGYVAPVAGGVIFGATYAPHEGDAAPAAEAADDARNLAAVAQVFPELARVLESAPLAGRAALRATTPDRLPYAGPVIDAEAFRAAAAHLAFGRAPHGAPAYHDGLYVLGGLGSRGLTLAPLLAEAVASEALGEPGALERGAAQALHPTRALARALKRGG